MIKRILSLVFAIAVVPASTKAKEANSYWIEYGNEPVLIQQNNNGAVQTLSLIHI